MPYVRGNGSSGGMPIVCRLPYLSTGNYPGRQVEAVGSSRRFVDWSKRPCQCGKTKVYVRQLSQGRIGEEAALCAHLRSANAGDSNRNGEASPRR